MLLLCWRSFLKANFDKTSPDVCSVLVQGELLGVCSPDRHLSWNRRADRRLHGNGFFLVGRSVFLCQGDSHRTEILKTQENQHLREAAMRYRILDTAYHTAD